jgi:hypothetical protein
MRRVFASAGIGLCVLVAVTAAAAAKPGPGQVAARAGRVVVDNSALKPSLPAQPALGALFGKARPASPPALTGYQVVTSTIFSNPNGTQVYGSVSCPAGTVAFGGGAIGGATALGQEINGSAPVVSGGLATGWEAWLDNSTGADWDFNVWAVCAKKPKQYAVVSLGFDNVAGQQSSATVSCPLNAKGKPLKVLGGGGIGGAAVPGQDINTSIPVGGKTHPAWRVDMNNNFASDQSASVWAVCGNAKGWKVITGAAVDNPPGAQTQADVVCPVGLTPVGGGEFSGSGSTLVNLNTTYPVGSSDWRTYEDNASAADTTTTPYVVCVL